LRRREVRGRRQTCADTPRSQLAHGRRLARVRGHRLRPVKQVLMLRGINLGPSRRVPMAELRALFGEAGYEDVRTYLQSGNLVLEITASAAALEAEGAALTGERLGIESPAGERTVPAVAAV